MRKSRKVGVTQAEEGRKVTAEGAGKMFLYQTKQDHLVQGQVYIPLGKSLAKMVLPWEVF